MYQQAHEASETSPEGPLNIVMSQTYRGPSGYPQEKNTKTYDLMKKMFFRGNSPCIIYLFLFLQKQQILKSSKRGRPRDVYRTQLRGVPGTK